MVEPAVPNGLAVEALGLSTKTYEWLIQTPSVFHIPSMGIVSMDDLLRREVYNLRFFPGQAPRFIGELERRLKANGIRLARPVEGPCIDPPTGSEWVRLPFTTSKPSWVSRSELPQTDLYRLIGASAYVIERTLGVHTIDDLKYTTAEEIRTQIPWSERNMSGAVIVVRLNAALEKLGLDPVR